MKQENVVICVTHVISKSFSTWTSDNQESTTLSNTLKSYPWELFSEIKESGGYGTVFVSEKTTKDSPLMGNNGRKKSRYLPPVLYILQVQAF